MHFAACEEGGWEQHVWACLPIARATTVSIVNDPEGSVNEIGPITSLFSSPNAFSFRVKPDLLTTICKIRLRSPPQRISGCSTAAPNGRALSSSLCAYCALCLVVLFPQIIQDLAFFLSQISASMLLLTGLEAVPFLCHAAVPLSFWEHLLLNLL